jgi:outer membrane protein OmpA-like peptidoglycan-associated protein
MILSTKMGAIKMRLTKKLSRNGIICALTMACLTLTTLAAADEATNKPWSLGVGGSGVLVGSEQKSTDGLGNTSKFAVNYGVSPTIRLGYDLSERWELLLGARYDFYDWELCDACTGTKDTEFDAYTFDLGVGYSWDPINLFGMDNVIPNVRLSGGYKILNADIDAYVEDYDNAFGLELAPGLRMGPWDTRLGLMYYKHGAKGNGDDLDLSGVFVEVLYRFDFGEKQTVKEEPKPVKEEPKPVAAPREPLDTDGDGVTDDKDACPGTIKGAKVDTKGCALPVDTDGDGVTDDKDKCPGTIKGAKVDAKGCALPVDTDGDGVTDDKDKCPGTIKGSEVDDKGCALKVDTDGDGLSNSEEQKLGLNYTKHDTDAGGAGDGIEVNVSNTDPLNPDDDPKNVVARKKIQINFRSDSAVFDNKHTNGLSEIAELMKKHPELSAKIEGHTDSDGKSTYNKILSQNRANSVIRELVDSFGVEESRLRARGYGEHKPIAENSTTEGKALNRRVEIVYLKE